MLNSLFAAQACAWTARNCLTRSPVDLALALFSYFVSASTYSLSGFAEARARLAFSALRHLRPREPADTRRAIRFSVELALAASPNAFVLCLHALSSFQRTG
jgi:hypothetical protein